MPCRSGCLRIRRQAFLNSVEHSLSQLDDTREQLNDTNSMSRHRADAAMLMAETSLQSAGREIATADRYQVIVSVDASELSTVDTAVTAKSNNSNPSKRPSVKGAGPSDGGTPCFTVPNDVGVCSLFQRMSFFNADAGCDQIWRCPIIDRIVPAPGGG